MLKYDDLKEESKRLWNTNHDDFYKHFAIMEKRIVRLGKLIYKYELTQPNEPLFRTYRLLMMKLNGYRKTEHAVPTSY